MTHNPQPTTHFFKQKQKKYQKNLAISKKNATFAPAIEKHCTYMLAG